MTLKLKNLLKNHKGLPYHDPQSLREAGVTQFGGGSNIIPDKTDSQGRNTWGDKVGYSDKEGPTSNAAVTKFDASLKGEPRWNNISKIMLRLSDPKQAEFIEYMMNDMGVTDEAKKRLKLKL